MSVPPSGPSSLPSALAPSVSIIIPTLNEAGQLPACLAAIGIDQPGVDVRVVDGGSLDETVLIAQRHGVPVLASTVAQRAAQMNHGAREAQGEVLLFLHADTLLPADWLSMLRAALAHDARIVGGGFRRRFDRPSAFLRFTCGLADWRVRCSGWLLGDQTMFVRRDAFFASGGFPALRQFEDLEFSIRLREQGRCVLVPATVISSGRRFDASGSVRQTLSDLAVTLRFLWSRSR